MTQFKPQCRPVLIGSLPLNDHAQAVQLIFAHTPDFPLWPQLPRRPKETMVRQFLSGMPGLTDEGQRFWIDDRREDFEIEMAAFYEAYLAAVEDDEILESSRFALDPEAAPGFFTLLDHIRSIPAQPRGVKGQITGPITTGIGVADHQGRNIIFNDNLRDMLGKLLALRARWQVHQLKGLGCPQPPLLFIDEPGMASFGSSAYIAITAEMVIASLGELIGAIQQAGGLAGLHICANGDFSHALTSRADIISFDAYTFFENFTLYRKELREYVARGGVLAWGIVPTLDPQAVDAETPGHLLEIWIDQLAALTASGLSERALLNQTLIAPACGTGALTPARAEKVLAMTRDLSAAIRNRYASRF